MFKSSWDRQAWCTVGVQYMVVTVTWALPTAQVELAPRHAGERAFGDILPRRSQGIGSFPCSVSCVCFSLAGSMNKPRWELVQKHQPLS